MANLKFQANFEIVFCDFRIVFVYLDIYWLPSFVQALEVFLNIL